MGWNNPPVSWKRLEGVLSGRSEEPVEPDGGDSPAWSRKREPYAPEGPMLERPESAVPYAELHCHSNYSFLDGASHPHELVREAVRLGLSALAITDHDGMYAVPKFSEVARFHRLDTVFGAELSLGLTAPQNGRPDPEGTHLLVLARDPDGYHNLCQEISDAHSVGKVKGRPEYKLEKLGGAHNGHWAVLTGCRKGAVRQALVNDGYDAAGRELDKLIDLFGRENVFVELINHGYPRDSEHNDALAGLALAKNLDVIATNNVHYARGERGRLAAALAAVRARRSMAELDGWLPPAAMAHLRSGEEMTVLFRRYPTAVERAAKLGAECAFDLKLLAPPLPERNHQDGHDDMSWLRKETMEGALRRYGGPLINPKAYGQIEHELRIIKELDFPGYFLIVHEIVEFCNREGILCQGRGSAANSAVCYALGITNVDAVEYKMMFERFLSPERDGYPDIDLDIESGRREEVIQHVYEKYGRENAAQVANVISYRPRSAVRDMAKALGYDQGQQDAWSKQLDRWGSVAATVDHDVPADVVALATEVLEFPRHLGIHSGGMVLCGRPVNEVCPVEWGRMPNRSVLQWDKDDCAYAGLVKFDLLGLGMLSALHETFDLLRRHYKVNYDLASIPDKDPAVYDMLCDADTVGVFQVESRAQMATLPRLKPREFYDLVVEVALIRPGPIQGGAVHPYIRRCNGDEDPDPPHPLLKDVLERTKGVPLFQEQLMQMAVTIAGFSPAEADQLRRAIGSKRSKERIEELRQRFYDGMEQNGITGALADDLYNRIAAFADFGFPESHAMSFALLVYASSWLKRYYPAPFCAALINAQPMGFYSPQSLVADVRRHGVRVRQPDINASAVGADLEPVGDDPGRPIPKYARHSPKHVGEAIRLGLKSVRTISDDLAKTIVSERSKRPYRDMADLASRVSLTSAQLEALATAGAFDCFGITRREALWAAGAVAHLGPDRLAGTVTGTVAPQLPLLSGMEEAMADVWATGISPTSFPTQFARDRLAELGAVTIAELAGVADKERVLVGGVVTHRQRPATAQGVTFLSLEDETGMLNVVCSQGLWARYRRVLRNSAALLIRGKLESASGVINLIADRVEPLPLKVRTTSRDFQ